MKFALCNELLQNPNRGWDETCRLIAEIGYDGVEVAPFTLSDDIRTISHHARNVYAQTARRAGVEVTGLHWLLVSPAGLSVTSRDESVLRKTTDYLADLVDLCADLGGQIMVLGSPAQRRIPPGDTAIHAADRLIAGLTPALARAERHHVTLCIEPLPAPESDFVLKLADAVALIQRVQHPNLKTIFDAKSASSEGEDLPILIHRFAPYLAHVHANDANRRGPGYGDTDFVPVLAALTEIAFDGFVSVEVFDDFPDPLTVAKESYLYLKRCLTEAQQRPEVSHG